MKGKITIIIVIILFSCSEKKSTNPLSQVIDLPKDLNEISGITYLNDMIYCIEDSGNENQVTILTTSGVISKTILLDDINNTDWEDLTFDINENLYIGDFGNNYNVRKDLAIYKIDKSNLQKKKRVVAHKISFDYPEQIDFPPKKKKLIFDVEAFFEYKNNFYLFTKNRSKDFDGTISIYKVPNVIGHHHAQLIKTFTTCNDYQNCAITGAAMSPDGSKFVLLSHSKIWLFEEYPSQNLYNAKMKEIDLNHYSQKEAVCFKDKNTLLIADERVKKTGGHLYEFNLQFIK